MRHDDRGFLRIGGSVALSSHHRALQAALWPRVDNQNPRDPKFYQSGIRARALGAHLNGIETFPFFAFAVLMAEFRQVPQPTLDLLAACFVGLRLLFVAAYLVGWGWTRTVIWNLGFFVNLAIFLLPIWR